MKKSQVFNYISLMKLPKELRELIHKKVLPITTGYEISRLAFDRSFPKVKGQTVKQWIAKDPENNIWDFVGTEPSDWHTERIKQQKKLSQDFMNGKIKIDTLKQKITSAIKEEKGKTL